MTTKIRILISTAVLVVASWLAYTLLPSEPQTPASVPPSTTRAKVSTIAAQDTQSSDTQKSPSTKAQEGSQLPKEALEKLEEYQSLFHTRDEMRDLIQHADELDDQTRRERFDKLMAEVHVLEQEKKVTSAEALLLQLAALKFSPDPEQAKEQGQALIEQYKQLSEARMQEYRDHPDPRFVSYKKQEAEIVKEVMKMSHYPDGLSRDKYLAQRLQALRSEIYKVE
ncbi:hypothetical protein BTA51_02245 [Hahella sp. CCB-MM4]|uniref:hypothetical protein n=1 Tax=Hahella sp. (strain CCB-MM4) TaxID=1926491 RepID=UPI000B9B9322|nr:hypothetical protein [Hahella sp. CCB-MM4]OZG75225.1 hypothetical protein BTA51_02245 [Hahella sp. CCB-MM4]